MLSSHRQRRIRQAHQLTPLVDAFDPALKRFLDAISVLARDFALEPNRVTTPEWRDGPHQQAASRV